MAPSDFEQRGPLISELLSLNELSYVALNKLSYVALNKLSYRALIELSYVASLDSELCVFNIRAPWFFRLLCPGKGRVVLMSIYGESEQTT